MPIKHFIKLSKPKRSAVYNTYWHFASKRQQVFNNRNENPTGPWTNDPIISKHRFTNIFRASDRVSQFLINLQYKEQDVKEIFFKTMLFKIFNKIDTYTFLEEELGQIKYIDFDFKQYDQLLRWRMEEGKTIYSAAYIMPSAGSVFGYKQKHSNHLALLHQMMQTKFYDRLQDANSLEEVYQMFLSCPSFGTFLAFQYTIDINYSSIINFSEMDFVVAGPGAINGISKCFDSFGDYSHADIIRLMADDQEKEFQRLEIEHPKLWGRELQLIDCQNLFCEVDKYLRGTHPELSAGSGRSRIKQLYAANHSPLKFFFPPKWNINNKIKETWQRTVTEGIFS